MENMNLDIAGRLSQLKTQFCDKETFLQIYNMDLWSRDSEAAGLFRVWADSLARKPKVLFPDKIDRWAFERFLQIEQYLPTRNAAMRFAMSEIDFTNAVDLMCEKGMLPSYTSKYKELRLFPISILDNLADHFKDMRFKFYNSQTEFINGFHNVIRKELELDITTIYSECSKSLNETPIEVAYEFDIITDEPMGIAHQVWLDFNKPLALKPDACSETTLNTYREYLQEWCFNQSADVNIQVL